MEQTQRLQKLPQVTIILVFLLVLYVPLLSWLVTKDSYYSETEKRELNTFPTIIGQPSITAFTKDFDRYYQDHFGLREGLIHRYQREMSKRFGATGFEDVVEGREGWLFYSGERLLDDLKGQLYFSEKQRQRFWEKLEERERWLKEHGAFYMFLVAPNKQSIYPEYLPSGMQQQTGQGTRLDMLLAGKKAEDRGPLLDARSSLLLTKDKVRLYDKTDTHWNYLGAYYAYQNLVDRTSQLFPDFQARPGFSFAKEYQFLPGGDLAVMIGRSKSMPEGRPVLETADFQAREKPLPSDWAELLKLPALQAQYMENPSGRLRVLVLHDSFFMLLKPFVSETYAEVLYVWKYGDRKTLAYFSQDKLARLVELYQPDLVIEETVERRLARFLFPYEE